MESWSFRKKRVVITGANGFIGSHMAMRMLVEGADVNVMVRESSDLWRLDKVSKDIELYRVDLRNSGEVEKYVRKIKPDYVFHMAAYGVDSRQKDYTIAAETNIIGTINLLKAVIDVGCKKFINTGTSMQYGNKLMPIREIEHYSPSNIYGSTKGAAVMIAHQIATENDINIATIIPFGVFGENEGSHKFFPHVILSVLGGKSIELSPCEQYRDYCYIENIIDGFLMAAANEKVKDEIFNIGSGDVYQLKHFVNLLVESMKCESDIKYGSVEYRKNDLWSPQPDISKITNMLGWSPRVSLSEGIDRTIEWFRANYDKYSVKGR
ncbi:MAG: CDP-abequose synthase [Clostridia bacterium BRH_c25]|nr:MAG: CDP-abequose synthase [Clostridia bacterium BRH_c25]